ncbi:MAG: hypothetical protein ACI4LI_02200 [Candidatus Fimenecus sp.]
MADGNGYIKLYRSILSWEWYQDVPTFVVFLHLLLTANYEDKHWKGTLIRRGETVTSYAKIAEETGVSYQQARNAVNKLKSTGEITQISTSRYSLIHIVNFDFYQDNTTGNETGCEQADGEKSNRQATTPKEIKNKEYIKKEKNIKKESFFVPPEIAEAFDGFVEMRKRKKNPMTDRAKKMLLNRLEELAPHDYPAQIKLLDEATLKGWLSVYSHDEKQSIGGERRGTARNDAADDTPFGTVY